MTLHLIAPIALGTSLQLTTVRYTVSPFIAFHLIQTLAPSNDPSSIHISPGIAPAVIV